MAKHFTDFSEYPVGPAPSGWTQWWGANPFEVGVGNILRLYEVSGYPRSAIAWDDVPESVDQEILVKYDPRSTNILILSLRSAGTTSRDGYVLFVRNDNNVLDLRRSLANHELTLGTAAFTVNNDTDYWVRFRVEGSTIKAKAWADGTAEPGTWTLERTNTELTSAGRMQVGMSGGTTDFAAIYQVGFASGGEDAPATMPLPPADPGYIPPIRQLANPYFWTGSTHWRSENTTNLLAARFRPTQTLTSNTLYIPMSLLGSPGAVEFSIRADSGGFPAGTSLASKQFTPTADINEIVFSSSITLNAGVDYWIVRREVVAHSASHRAGWKSISGTPDDANAIYTSYPNTGIDGRFQAASYNGSSWSYVATNQAFAFRFGGVGQPSAGFIYRQIHGVNEAGQRLNLTENLLINGLRFRLKKVGTPPSPLRWRITASSPSTVYADGFVANPADIGTSYTMVDVNMATPVEIPTGSQYFSLYTTGGDASNYYEVTTNWNDFQGVSNNLTMSVLNYGGTDSIAATRAGGAYAGSTNTDLQFDWKQPGYVLTHENIIAQGTKAFVVGEGVDFDGWGITERGICWSTSPAPTIADSSMTVHGVGDSPHEFTAELTGLTPSTEYFARAFVKSGGGVFYGNEIAFTTQAADLEGHITFDFVWDAVFASFVDVAPDSATHTLISTSPAVADSYELIPAGSNHLQTVSSPALSSQYNVVPENVTHSQTATSPTVNPIFTASPANASHAISSTSPTLSYSYQLNPHSTTHGHIAQEAPISSLYSVSPVSASQQLDSSEPAIVSSYAVAPNSATQSIASTDPSILATPPIQTDSAVQSITSTEPLVTPLYDVQPDNAAHAHSASLPSVFSAYYLQPASASHDQSAPSPAVTHSYAVQPANALQGHLADEVTVSSSYELNPTDSSHSITSTDGALTHAYSVTPDSVTQAHYSDEPSLMSGFALLPDNASHDHTAGEPSLVQHHHLNVDSATHTQTADEPIVDSGYFLQPDSSLHDHLAIEGSLLQHHQLTVDNVLHTQTTTEPIVFASNEITPDSPVHSHSASQPGLNQDSTIQPASTWHTQTATSPTFSAQYSLAVDNAHHFHSADEAIASPVFMVVPDSSAHAIHSTEPALSLENLLQPHNAADAHTATSPTLQAIYDLLTDDATHTITSQEPVVFGNELLQPHDAGHSISSNEPSLDNVYLVAPHSSEHSISSTEAILAAFYDVQPDNAHHDHLADETYALTGILLEPDDCYHIFQSISPTLTSRRSLGLYRGRQSFASGAGEVYSHGDVFMSKRVDVMTGKAPIYTPGHDTNVSD